jgi:hypothetical protein
MDAARTPTGGSRNLSDRQPRRMRGLDGRRSFALRLVPAKICGPQSFDEAYALARRFCLHTRWYGKVSRKLDIRSACAVLLLPQPARYSAENAVLMAFLRDSGKRMVRALASLRRSFGCELSAAWFAEELPSKTRTSRFVALLQPSSG